MNTKDKINQHNWFCNGKLREEYRIAIANKLPHLKMLVLFGSHARGDNYKNSDWDFAARLDADRQKEHSQHNTFGWLEVSSILEDILNLHDTEIDIVELNKASELMAHLVARDGILIYEDEPGQFKRFCEYSLKTEEELKEMRSGMRKKIEHSLQRKGV
ncbi:MAG: nucleotidyltransferase domain-containing protein [Richelia sp. SM2_1_7]|nr:nucleotidyltransferase domain-containing protein [Richelia sp. SM2_1_7]